MKEKNKKDELTEEGAQDSLVALRKYMSIARGASIESILDERNV